MLGPGGQEARKAIEAAKVERRAARAARKAAREAAEAAGEVVEGQEGMEEDEVMPGLGPGFGSRSEDVRVMQAVAPMR